MDERIKILLLSDTLDSPTNRALQQALAPVGEIHLAGEAELDRQLVEGSFQLLILDASLLTERPDELIREVKSKYPDLQIVLLTASPHWKVAKAVILAGANYIENSQDAKTLAVRFVPVLEAIDAGR